MIYLDYSATTPVDDRVLQSFNKTCTDYVGNTNSFHKLGLKSKDLMDEATNQVAKLLKVYPSEIIYTSGATESNNLAIKGVVEFYKNRGNHIITTKLEHASIKEPLNYLKKHGYEISYVKLLEDGTVDLNHLKGLIKDSTILVSICYIDSEIGIKQPIEAIGDLLKQHSKIIFHVDATQAVGKINLNIENVDLISFSAHKFYGLKGIGCLIKKAKIELEPLLHGGKSQSKYRSGTPALPLIVSLSKALRLALEDLDDKYNSVLKLNKKIIKKLEIYGNVKINSTDKSIPHIINISILGIKPETMVHALDEHEIYISTKSACSDLSKPSESLIALHRSNEEAGASLRICLSYKTTEEEVDTFLHYFDIEYNALLLKKGE